MNQGFSGTTSYFFRPDHISSIPKPIIPSVEISVFRNDLIQYCSGDSLHADSVDVSIADKGREITNQRGE